MSTVLLLVGCKGNGNSHTGNTILGQEAFRVTRKGGTEKSSLGSSSHGKVTVVDTPGVSHEMTESEFEELVQAVKMVPEGFDAICLVWDYNNSERNEDKEVQVFQSLHRLFGDGLYEHLVIVVTHAQQEDIPEFVNDLPNAMKEIAEQCHNRVIAIENRGNLANKQEALKTLNECISELSNSARRYVTSDLSPICQIPEGEELGIVLVGKTGVGKSHTGNNITGTKKFRVSDKAKSETRVCKQHIRQKDRQITVLDTPGVFDTGNVEDICKELCRIVTFFPNGLHAVILVLRRGRFTWEEAETIKLYELMFGERLLKHSLLLITAKDELTSSEEEYLKTAPDDLKNVLKKCGNRCVFFNNVSKDETILRMQLVNMIRLVDTITKEEGVYNDDWFEEGRKEMNKIIQDITGSKATWKDLTRAVKKIARDRAMNEDYRNTNLFGKFYEKLQSNWHQLCDQVKSLFGKMVEVMSG
ncbi:GTPase IMAP family member 7-like [Branchiostoma floridae]|uniref:GTPase IMAP family member 7-like n=2 Tax=Branchiostoma floridae TaxID=7739 RepID=A0A9J7L271_BRAFL|nr:GTPase IMAP family member 7-like [Branchiostoma floridae]